MLKNKEKRYFERTLILIKPDGVQRRLVGEIIKRFERACLKIVGLKLLLPSQELVEKHYPSSNEWFLTVGQKGLKGGQKEEQIALGKAVKRKLVDFLTCSPIVACVFEGPRACAIAQKIVGSTEPLTSDVGTIRGDFTVDSYDIADAMGRAVRNLVHASESPSEAEREIKVWFKDEELINYHTVDEVLLTDVNLDGLKE